MILHCEKREVIFTFLGDQDYYTDVEFHRDEDSFGEGLDNSFLNYTELFNQKGGIGRAPIKDQLFQKGGK